MAEDDVQKTLYLTENLSKSDDSGDIEVPPPMLLVRIPMDFTGEVALGYNQGKLVQVLKKWNEKYRPIPLSDSGFVGERKKKLDNAVR